MSQSRRLRLLAHTALSILVAVAVAALWPLERDEVRGDFFLAVSASVLTIFGLAFSMILLSSDLGQARGRIGSRRSFSWEVYVYLLLFTAIVLWCLLVAYAADGGGVRKGQLCLITGERLCLRGRHVSQLSIGSTALLLFLMFPFIGFIYRGLSPRQVLADHAYRATRARSENELERRMDQLRRQILAFNGDRDVKVLNSSLQALGSVSVTVLKSKRRFSMWPTLAREITSTISRINDQTVRDSYSIVEVIRFSTDWATASIDSIRAQPTRATPGITNREVQTQFRSLLDLYNRNLRRYSDGELPTDAALESLRAVNRIAVTCRDQRISLPSFADSAEAILLCLRAGPDTATRRGLTGCLGGMIRLAKTASDDGANLDGSYLTAKLMEGVSLLASYKNYQLPPWFALEFSRVCNPLILRSSGHLPSEVADAIARLPLPVLSALVKHLAGPPPLACRWELQVAQRALEYENWNQAALLASLATTGFAELGDKDAALTAFSLLADAYTEGGRLHPGRINQLANQLRRMLLQTVTTDIGI